MLKGKKIVLGITGSIAAYKACLTIRELVKQGAEVQVVITPAGKEFITPITLSALTHKPVISEFFAQRDGTWNSHVDLGLWADAMLIAPCTASTLGKMANGIADNMLITTYLSMKAPVFVAPAIHILITAGPTYEKIDPVRFIGNYSSGKMGFALAEECAQRGADVTLIAGPVSVKCSDTIHRINIESCQQMYEAATEAFPRHDAAILCAAVADFRPENVAEKKIKRKGDDLVIRLKPTHDIAAALGKMKQPDQRLVGFALETNDEDNQRTAEAGEEEPADFIVLNSLRIRAPHSKATTTR